MNLAKAVVIFGATAGIVAALIGADPAFHAGTIARIAFFGLLGLGSNYLLYKLPKKRAYFFALALASLIFVAGSVLVLLVDRNPPVLTMGAGVLFFGGCALVFVGKMFESVDALDSRARPTPRNNKIQRAALLTACLAFAACGVLFLLRPDLEGRGLHWMGLAVLLIFGYGAAFNASRLRRPRPRWPQQA